MSIRCVSHSVTDINKNSKYCSKIPPYESLELWDACSSMTIPDWVGYAQKCISESTDIYQKSIPVEIINFRSPQEDSYFIEYGKMKYTSRLRKIIASEFMGKFLLDYLL